MVDLFDEKTGGFVRIKVIWFQRCCRRRLIEWLLRKPYVGETVVAVKNSLGDYRYYFVNPERLVYV